MVEREKLQALGTQWYPVGETRPAHGDEILNEKLRAALDERQQFAEEDIKHILTYTKYVPARSASDAVLSAPGGNDVRATWWEQLCTCFASSQEPDLTPLKAGDFIKVGSMYFATDGHKIQLTQAHEAALRKQLPKLKSQENLGLDEIKDITKDETKADLPKQFFKTEDVQPDSYIQVGDTYFQEASSDERIAVDGLWRKVLVAVLNNLRVIAFSAINPAHLDEEHVRLVERMDAAYQGVIIRNPLPEDEEIDPDTKAALQIGKFLVDGIEVSYSYSDWTPEQKREAKKTFIREREQIACKEAQLVIRDYPLLTPMGKFWVESTLKLVLAALLTFTAPPHDLSFSWWIFVVWIVQLLVQECREIMHDRKLYMADILNPVELFSLLCVLLGLFATIYVPLYDRVFPPDDVNGSRRLLDSQLEVQYEIAFRSDLIGRQLKGSHPSSEAGGHIGTGSTRITRHDHASGLWDPEDDPSKVACKRQQKLIVCNPIHCCVLTPSPSAGLRASSHGSRCRDALDLTVVADDVALSHRGTSCTDGPAHVLGRGTLFAPACRASTGICRSVHHPLQPL